ncbi:MAG: HD-GYP domain-containing protein [Bacillota bacterium]|jgi:HD-GYP domain-containing protein (c-di-GMP phosphodiesterase class II)
MRILATEDLREGMVLARTIYDGAGRVVLAKGTTLKPTYIKRLGQLGYPYVYILDPSESLDQVDFDEPITEETRVQAISLLRDAVESVKKTGTADLSQISSIVDEIIEQILSNPDVIVSMVDIKSYDSYTYSHSVNVCVLSVMLGLDTGMNEFDVKELGEGAILHDIGKLFVPCEILNKSGPLTEEEFEVIRRHTTDGFDVLRKKNNISLFVAHVAYQHHERLDGSGYPRRLKGDEIHEYAKIAAIVDSYDAMTSDRVYRSALTPYEAVSILVKETDTKYDRDLVGRFLKLVATYPIGSVVRLNNGEVCTVVNVNKRSLVVRVLRGRNRGREYDLLRNPDLRVVGRVL